MYGIKTGYLLNQTDSIENNPYEKKDFWYKPDIENKIKTVFTFFKIGDHIILNENNEEYVIASIDKDSKKLFSWDAYLIEIKRIKE